MGYSCACRADGVCAFSTSVIRTARKDHRCEGCSRIIKRGRMYQVEKSVSNDTGWVIEKSCMTCATIMKRFFKCTSAYHLIDDFYHAQSDEFEEMIGPRAYKAMVEHFKYVPHR